MGEKDSLTYSSHRRSCYACLAPRCRAVTAAPAPDYLELYQFSIWYLPTHGMWMWWYEYNSNYLEYHHQLTELTDSMWRILLLKKEFAKTTITPHMASYRSFTWCTPVQNIDQSLPWLHFVRNTNTTTTFNRDFLISGKWHCAIIFEKYWLGKIPLRNRSKSVCFGECETAKHKKE